MHKFSLSLRRQLTLWLLLPLILVLSISAAISYHRTAYFVNRAYDHSLYRAALALADQVVIENNKIVSNLPPSARDLLVYDEDDTIYYRITAPDGSWVIGEKELPLPKSLPKADSHLYYDAEFKEDDIRVVAFSLPIQGTDVKGNVLIQVGETLNKRNNLVQEIMGQMIIPQLLILLLAIGVIFIGIKRGLLPLQHLQAAIHQRSHRDLSELATENAPHEIQPLIKAMNDLMQRVRETVRLQQQFIADASHQMRTPIAGLQTQAELALREKDPAMIRSTLALILSSTSRLSHLISRLLSMASVDPAAGRDAKLAPLDLITLTRRVTSEFISQASQKQIDLGLDIQASSANIVGDELMLREMLANLIDNAICYTPNQGTITVSIEKSEQKIELSIIDNGVGIPPKDRSQVFERFHRLHDNDGQGCGLGLAIVREVVLAHRAEIRIDDGLPQASGSGVGTKMTVTFHEHTGA